MKTENNGIKVDIQLLLKQRHRTLKTHLGEHSQGQIHTHNSCERVSFMDNYINSWKRFPADVQTKFSAC